MSTDPGRDLDRAIVLLDLGRANEARDLLVGVCAADPDDVDAIVLLALAHSRTGQHDEAIRWATHGVRLAPDLDESHRIRSVVQVAAGRAVDGEESARRALRLVPHRPANLHALASALADQPYQLIKAEHTAAKLLELCPDDPSAHFLVGLIAQRRDHKDEAMAAYRRVLALQPDHAEALNNLGVLEPPLSPTRTMRRYAAALGADASLDVVRSNIRVTVRRAVGLVATAAAVVLGIALILEGRIVGLVAIGADLSFLVMLGIALARMPRSIRRFLPTVLRSELVETLWPLLLIYLLALGGAVVIAVLDIALEGPGFLAFIPALVTRFVVLPVLDRRSDP